MAQRYDFFVAVRYLARPFLPTIPKWKHGKYKNCSFPRCLWKCFSRGAIVLDLRGVAIVPMTYGGVTLVLVQEAG